MSAVGGLLFLLFLFMVIFFSLKYSGCFGSPEPESESTSEESFSEYSHEHVHSVSGCEGCKNHYPEWVYNELKNQLVLAQKVQKEHIEVKGWFCNFNSKTSLKTNLINELVYFFILHSLRLSRLSQNTYETLALLFLSDCKMLIKILFNFTLLFLNFCARPCCYKLS